MKRSDLIQRLSASQSQLTAKDVDSATRVLIEKLANTLASGDRIEIRGFGSFRALFRAARWGRNPRTGEKVFVPSKHILHFKPGGMLRHRLNSRSKSGK